jgi:hypothetical protein
VPEFPYQFATFILTIVIVMIASLGFIWQLRDHYRYSKPPQLDAYFVLNPNTPNEATTKTLNAPASEIFVYFASDVKDNRKYIKPYAVVKFPIDIRIRYDFAYWEYWYGVKPHALKSNEAGFFSSEHTLSKVQKSSQVFPLLIDLQGKSGTYQIAIELGAENINAPAKEVQLTLNITDGNYSHDIRYFRAETYKIT